MHKQVFIVHTDNIGALSTDIAVSTDIGAVSTDIGEMSTSGVKYSEEIHNSYLNCKLRT